MKRCLTLLGLAAAPSIAVLGVLTGVPWLSVTSLGLVLSGVFCSALWILAVLAGFWAPGVRTPPRVPIAVYFFAVLYWCFSFAYVEAQRADVVGHKVQETHGRTLAAIQSFYADTGSLPQELGELVPHYMAEIPSVTRGDCDPLKYRLASGGSCELTVHFGALRPLGQRGLWIGTVYPSAKEMRWNLMRTS